MDAVGQLEIGVGFPSGLSDIVQSEDDESAGWERVIHRRNVFPVGGDGNVRYPG